MHALLLSSLLSLLAAETTATIPARFMLSTDYQVEPVEEPPPEGAPKVLPAAELPFLAPASPTPARGPDNGAFPGINPGAVSLDPGTAPGAFGMDRSETSALGLVAGALLVGTLNPKANEPKLEDAEPVTEPGAVKSPAPEEATSPKP